MKKIILIASILFFGALAMNAQEVEKIGNAQSRLGAFGFRYTTWTVKFTDGTSGKLCQNEKTKKYFVDTGSHEAYYKSRAACIKALYYYKKEGKLIKEGKE